MNIFIPTIGTRFVLNAPWTFHLHDEYRNYDFWASIHGGPPPRKEETERWYSRYDSFNKPIKTTLPVGTILSVDRIYIRKGSKEFDSVSFRVLKGSPIPTGRFWAKLNEVNTDMSVNLMEEPY